MKRREIIEKLSNSKIVKWLGVGLVVIWFVFAVLRALQGDTDILSFPPH